MGLFKKLFGKSEKNTYSLDGLQGDMAQSHEMMDASQPIVQEGFTQEDAGIQQNLSGYNSPFGGSPRTDVGAQQPIREPMQQSQYTRETLPVQPRYSREEESKDMQLIMSKLDVISSRLENVSKRLEMLEQRDTSSSPQRRVW